MSVFLDFMIHSIFIQVLCSVFAGHVHRRMPVHHGYPHPGGHHGHFRPHGMHGGFANPGRHFKRQLHDDAKDTYRDRKFGDPWFDSANVARNAEFGDPSAYGRALDRVIIGGGISGTNLGGANDPRAAASNIFHDPAEVAAHEMGALGSGSPLTQNMLESDNPTVKQRVLESADNVHDDNIKANLAVEQQLKNQLANRQRRALSDMQQQIKLDAADAALRDAEAARTKAQYIAANAPNGDLDATMAGTNKTYRDVVEELQAAADHAEMHANNIDLYELEAEARKVGLPYPTLGKDIFDAEKRNLIHQREREAVAAKEAEKAAEEEQRAQAELEQKQLEQAKQQLDAEKREAEKSAIEEREAVAAAAANDLYAQAAEQAQVGALESSEALAASALTAAEVKRRAAELASAAQTVAGAEEAQLLNIVNATRMKKAAEDAQAMAEIARNEALVAKLGEDVRAQADIAGLNRAVASLNASRENLERQAAAEALAAEQNARELTAALTIDPSNLARVGEAAIEAGALLRGRELSAAATESSAVAEAARQRGALQAAARANENDIAELARLRGDALKQNQILAAEAQQQAAAEAARLAAEAAKEQKIAAVAKDERERIEKEAAEKAIEEAKQGAGFEKDDPYKILGTIPDDADEVAIKNSSIRFPLKTFGTTKAHTQAEAGAIAAQNKIKDDIRGKVTADRFDTPLNVIKGEAGYLNVPENAQKVDVESGRVYMTESGVQQMQRDGLDTSMFEQRINTGERSDMGIGLKYYVADASGMAMDMPTPGNPDPPRVLIGNNKTIDISRAEGLDIEKGALRLEKWSEYSRRIRPTVNASVQASGHEAVIDALVDDDCVRQALRDADALFNTASELHINPSGEKYITLRPPYGVTETLRFDEAVANLNRIQQSCRITHGQTGISIMQESDLKSTTEEARNKHRQINVAESSGEVCITTSEEERIRLAALQQAANSHETHAIINRENAFDHKTHDSKTEIVEAGAKAIEIETGMDREEAINEVGTTREEVEEAKEALLAEKTTELDASDEVSKAVTEEIKREEEAIRDAGEIKMMMQRESAAISREMGISEEEMQSLLASTNISIFKSFITYARNPHSESAREAVTRSKNELRIVFGTHSETFTKLVYANISKKFKITDPDEHVIIKKETTLVPMIVSTSTSPNKFGGHTTTFKQSMVPRTVILRIPVTKKVKIHTKQQPGGNVAGVQMQNYPNAPAGPVISGKLDPQKGDPSAVRVVTTIPNKNDLIGPGGLGQIGEKIKVGDNATLVGLNSEIDQMVDPASIGNITKPGVTNKLEIKDTGIVEKGTAFPSSGRVLGAQSRPLTFKECKNVSEECKKLTG